MLLLAGGEKRMGRAIGGVDATETGLHEVVVCGLNVREREQLHEVVAAVICRVLHEVAVVKERVHVAHY